MFAAHPSLDQDFSLFPWPKTKKKKKTITKTISRAVFFSIYIYIFLSARRFLSFLAVTPTAEIPPHTSVKSRKTRTPDWNTRYDDATVRLRHVFVRAGSRPQSTVYVCVLAGTISDAKRITTSLWISIDGTMGRITCESGGLGLRDDIGTKPISERRSCRFVLDRTAGPRNREDWPWTHVKLTWT